MNRNSNWNWNRPSMSGSQLFFRADGYSSIDEQVKAIDAQIAIKYAQIAELQQSAKNWRDSKSQCPGLKSSSKYKSCAQGKEDQALIQDNAANRIPPQIDELKASKAALLAKQLSENEATKTLAGQGKSFEALRIEAQGKAKATEDDARIRAEATAKSMDTESKAKASAMKTSATTNKAIIVMVIVTVVIITTIVIVKKIRAKKKAKTLPAN